MNKHSISTTAYATLTQLKITPQFSMYIIPIAWLYVVVLMSLAEATSRNGTVLGAIITFVFYGVIPIALVLYFMGAPARKRAIRAREAAELQSSREPDASGLPTTDAIPAVRKEP